MFTKYYKFIAISWLSATIKSNEKENWKKKINAWELKNFLLEDFDLITKKKRIKSLIMI